MENNKKILIGIGILAVSVIAVVVLISGHFNQINTGAKPQVEEQFKSEKSDLEKESDWCTKNNFNLSAFGTVFASTDSSAKWDLIDVATESETIEGEAMEMCCGKLKLGGEVGNEKVKMEMIFNGVACYDKSNKYEFIDMKFYYNGEYNPGGSYIITGWPESGKRCHKVVDGNGTIFGEGCE